MVAAHASNFPPYDGTAERDAFWAFHNERVADQLRTQEKQLADDLAKAADDAAKVPLQTELDRVRARLAKPEFFTFATPADLPAGLVWENGLSEPEIGDPQARKGGTFTGYIPSFPPTIRVLGENANNAFRGYHYDDIEMGFVGLHPETGAVIPSLAKEWAVSPDSRTVYYRIDPDAKYSDGVPVEADDWFNTFYMQLSEYPQNPFGNEWYSSQ